MRQETFDKALIWLSPSVYAEFIVNNGIFDSIPVFSNITLYANTAYTDWSWGGLFMDMDNDGSRIFCVNRSIKDINNQIYLPGQGVGTDTGKKRNTVRNCSYPCKKRYIYQSITLYQ
jgi:hypothetical protein